MKKLFLLLTLCSPLYSMRYLKTSPYNPSKPIYMRHFAGTSSLQNELAKLFNQLLDAQTLLEFLEESYSVDNHDATQAIIKRLPEELKESLDTVLRIKSVCTFKD